MTKSYTPNETISVQMQIQGGGQSNQHLEIIKQIGDGGMSKVYLVKRSGVPEGTQHQYAAMKLFDPKVFSGGDDAINRFHREIRLMSELHHPSLAEFVGSGMTSEGDPFFLAEYINGQTLGYLHHERAKDLGHVQEKAHRPGSYRIRTFAESLERLEKGLDSKIEHPALELSHVRVIMKKSLECLAYLHAKGIVHRDIKLDNIMYILDDDQNIVQIKILDLGISKIIKEGDAHEQTCYTQTGTAVGTPEYMPYEQLMALRNQIDHRVDIYAMGLILASLLTSLRVMNTDQPNYMVLILARSTKIEASVDPAFYIENLSDAIRYVVLKATEFDPKDRYQSANEFLEALEEAFDGRISDPAYAQTIEQKFEPISTPPVSARPSITEIFSHGAKKTFQIGSRLMMTAVLISVFLGLIGTIAYFAYARQKGEDVQLIKNAQLHAQTLATSVTNSVVGLVHGEQPAPSELIPVAVASAESVAKVPVSHLLNATQTASYNLGVRLLNSRNAKAALRIFLSLEDDGVQDPKLFGSIATAYGRMGKAGKSSEYLKKKNNLE